jgi:hypothetical protein
LGAKSHLDVGFERIGVSGGALWVPLLAGPLAFAAAQFMNYALVRRVCSSGSRLLLLGITAAAFLMVSAAFASSLRSLRRVPAEAPLDAAGAASVARFMATLGAVSCAFFMVALFALAIPPVVFNDCR